MKDELIKMLARVATTQLALESLRGKNTAQALEFLELDLDASILGLSRLSKEVLPDERERVINTLQMVRDYRRAHPRRVEADLSSFASGLLVRAGQQGTERVRKILEEAE